MNNTVKRILTLSVEALLCSLCSCGYVATQAFYFVKYASTSRSNASVLADVATSDSVRALIERARMIKKFSEDSIGLKKDRNFDHLITVPRDYLLNVVSACKSDTFKLRMWNYPLIGQFPYNGYYKRTDAIAEAKMLKNQGYDVSIWQSDAFSTLGIFSDPLYTFMRHYPDYMLAMLIIHEQTHATLFFPNDVQFSEAIASLIGDQGALLYVKNMYGAESEQYRAATGFFWDYAIFNSFIAELYDSLNSLYSNQSFRRMESTRKLAVKDSIITDFKKNRYPQSYVPKYVTEQFKNIDRTDINNAYLVARMTYSGDLPRLYVLFKKNDSNVHRMFSVLKTKLAPFKSKRDVMRILDSLADK